MIIKQLNIRGGSDYFYGDLKDFDPDSIKLGRNELANNVFIYHVSYAKKCPLRFYVGELDGHFTEKREEKEKREGWSNKYLNISSTDANHDVLINYAKVWKGISNKISEICNRLEGEYDKDLMKIAINSDDDLMWDKVINLHMLTITNRHVFKKGDKYRPQIFLTDCFYDDV